MPAGWVVVGGQGVQPLCPILIEVWRLVELSTGCASSVVRCPVYNSRLRTEFPAHWLDIFTPRREWQDLCINQDNYIYLWKNLLRNTWHLKSQHFPR